MEIGRIRSILDQGNGITLTEISDILNSKQDELEMSNKEVKVSLMEQLQVSIQICLSKKKNESLLVFSTKPSAQVIVQKVGSTDIIKSAALSLPHTILEESFDYDDKFCDADDLERSWKKTKISDKLMTFFSTLFIIKMSLILSVPVFNETHLQSPDFVEDDKDTERKNGNIKFSKLNLFAN